jgi:hypothetical protein
MKLSRKQLRRIISEAIGFGRDPMQPTGKIIVIRKQDPKYKAYIGYDIKGVIRNLVKASEIDRVIETLDLNNISPQLTHHYVLSNKTMFDKDLQKFNDRGMMRDIYDSSIHMMFKPWMMSNDRQNEKHFIYDLVNTKIKELGYLPMSRRIFDNLGIQYLDQEVSIEHSGKTDIETGEKQFKTSDVGDVEGVRQIGFKPQFD